MANQSMKDAAKELGSKSNAADNDPMNCDISCDGDGCVTTISMDTGKVLDVEIMSRFCKSCAVHYHLPESSEKYS